MVVETIQVTFWIIEYKTVMCRQEVFECGHSNIKFFCFWMSALQNVFDLWPIRPKKPKTYI